MTEVTQSVARLSSSLCFLRYSPVVRQLSLLTKRWTSQKDWSVSTSIIEKLCLRPEISEGACRSRVRALANLISSGLSFHRCLDRFVFLFIYTTSPLLATTVTRVARLKYRIPPPFSYPNSTTFIFYLFHIELELNVLRVSSGNRTSSSERGSEFTLVLADSTHSASSFPPSTQAFSQAACVPRSRRPLPLATAPLSLFYVSLCLSIPVERSASPVKVFESHYVSLPEVLRNAKRFRVVCAIRGAVPIFEGEKRRSSELGEERSFTTARPEETLEIKGSHDEARERLVFLARAHKRKGDNWIRAGCRNSKEKKNWESTILSFPLVCSFLRCRLTMRVSTTTTTLSLNRWSCI